MYLPTYYMYLMHYTASLGRYLFMNDIYTLELKTQLNELHHQHLLLLLLHHHHLLSNLSEYT
jgi:hypothetical protein